MREKKVACPACRKTMTVDLPDPPEEDGSFGTVFGRNTSTRCPHCGSEVTVTLNAVGEMTELWRPFLW